jgi:hypothetical protein
VDGALADSEVTQTCPRTGFFPRQINDPLAYTLCDIQISLNSEDLVTVQKCLAYERCPNDDWLMLGISPPAVSKIEVVPPTVMLMAWCVVVYQPLETFLCFLFVG